MKNILKLNVPALSSPLSITALDIRPYTSGVSYIDTSRMIKQATEEVPVYRLAKDYELNGATFALNLIITDSNAGKAEDFMDKVAKKVTEEQIKNVGNPFTWLEEAYKVKAGK